MGEQRGVLEVEIQLPGSAPLIRLLATHFDYRRRSPERLLSARMVNDLIASRNEAPALLVGDLNDTPRGRTLLELGKRWQLANRCITPTYPVRCPYKQIDYVMFHPHASWQVIETRVLDERIASDHRPFLAVLELHPEGISDTDERQ